jgi:hypothetical protein
MAPGAERANTARGAAVGTRVAARESVERGQALAGEVGPATRRLPRQRARIPRTGALRALVRHAPYSKLRRSCGPECAADFGLRAHVDVIGESNASTVAHFGVSDLRAQTGLRGSTAESPESGLMTCGAPKRLRYFGGTAAILLTYLLERKRVGLAHSGRRTRRSRNSRLAPRSWLARPVESSIRSVPPMNDATRILSAIE